MARSGKFKKLCTMPDCVEEVDYTEEVVLDNLIRGLREEEIKTRIMALDDTACTMKTVLKLVQAEELGRRSVRAAKDMEGVYAVSGYQQQRREAGLNNKVVGNQGTPGPGCRNCGLDPKHDVCPAKDQNCQHCGKRGHFARVCEVKKAGGPKAVAPLRTPRLSGTQENNTITEG